MIEIKNNKNDGMIFLTTSSGKQVRLSEVKYQKETGSLFHPDGRMETYKIPTGFPTNPWELKKALRKKGVKMI